jgi:serine/threonine protein kinase
MANDDVRSIRDFQVISILGKGAMGVVWHAHRKNTNETYAIKSIQKSTDTQIERVLQERAILTSVNNPFVMKMHWAFQDDSHIYFVLEHAKGGDLSVVTNTFHPGGMSEGHARFYIAEILLALEYLHTMNIVVRDLKPANCLTTASGHIMLTDFSHSKWLLHTGTGDSQASDYRPLDGSNNQQADDDFSDEDDCAGTPEYLAPEVLVDQAVTKMVDYWSLGIILYELIYARLPWGSCADKAVVDLFYSIITHPLCFTDGEDTDCNISTNDEMAGGAVCTPKTRSRVSAVAKDLMTRLLEKDPATRIGSNMAEVKAHTFFNQPGSELDWAAAQRGELVPPPREIPTQPTDGGDEAAQWSRFETFANPPAKQRKVLKPLESRLEADTRTPIDILLESSTHTRGPWTSICDGKKNRSFPQLKAIHSPSRHVLPKIKVRQGVKAL